MEIFFKDMLNSQKHIEKVSFHKKFFPICPLQILNPKLNQLLAEIAVHSDATINMIMKKQNFGLYDKKIERLFSDFSMLKSNVPSSDRSESRNHITIGDELIFLESTRLKFNKKVIENDEIKYWKPRSYKTIVDNFTSNAMNHFREVYDSKKIRHFRNKKSILKK